MIGRDRKSPWPEASRFDDAQTSVLLHDRPCVNHLTGNAGINAVRTRVPLAVTVHTHRITGRYASIKRMTGDRTGSTTICPASGTSHASASCAARAHEGVHAQKLLLKPGKFCGPCFGREGRKTIRSRGHGKPYLECFGREGQEVICSTRRGASHPQHEARERGHIFGLRLICEVENTQLATQALSALATKGPDPLGRP